MEPQTRPDTLNSKTICIPTGLGKLYITITYIDNKPFEVFTIIGKCGSDITAMTEGLSRIISLWLRSGGDIKHIIKQLKGIGGASQIPYKTKTILSIPDAIAIILEKEIKELQKWK